MSEQEGGIPFVHVPMLPFQAGLLLSTAKVSHLRSDKMAG